MSIMSKMGSIATSDPVAGNTKTPEMQLIDERLGRVIARISRQESSIREKMNRFVSFDTKIGSEGMIKNPTQVSVVSGLHLKIDSLTDLAIRFEELSDRLSDLVGR